MKLAYLILAHDNPRHLRRLVGRLSSGSSTFFIHIDRKADLADFSGIEGSNVHFTRRRIAVNWGDFSMVEATLVLIREVLEHEGGFDRLVFLSGADYPLRAASSIESFFENHPATEFMNIVPMPCEAAGKPIWRLTRYTPRPGSAAITRLLRGAMVKIGAASMERDYKAYLGDRVPYGGSQWWALTRGACQFVRKFVEKEGRIVGFFRNTFCPDESFFQTILGNSAFNAKMRRNLTYADWSAGGKSPAYMTMKHLDMFRTRSSFTSANVYGPGEMLFARKFSDGSEEVTRQIDELIGGGASAPR